LAQRAVQRTVLARPCNSFDAIYFAVQDTVKPDYRRVLGLLIGQKTEEDPNMTKTENLKTFAEAVKTPNCRLEQSRPALANLEIGGLPIPDGKRVLSIAAFCHCYDIGRTMAYVEMAAGRLRYCKVGRSRRVRVDDAEAWSLSTRQPSPSGPGVSSRWGAE
jgi:hypothetical protein